MELQKFRKKWNFRKFSQPANRVSTPRSYYIIRDLLEAQNDFGQLLAFLLFLEQRQWENN
jgi:hypothetical protein